MRLRALAGKIAIERSLFKFIWAYSRRDQLKLLAVTACLFPLLYLTLELPKRIINDAIGAPLSPIDLLGFSVDQTTLLVLLCLAFLLSVLAHGLLKMRINTMKGVLSERMLRRLRYTLIARILRFPRPYFERTSQGELVSMVTAEAEPMGGLMGDAISQPVLQAGQMLTILSFLFLQSVWFGLAAVALIPLQAWLIPMLQRQINALNKSRIAEVRALSTEIGETAQGAVTLRLNAGWRFRLAMITDRLARLFGIRFKIYQKKFFMKFLNNFINQLTPFFFYLVGGYLAIRGEITVGALVAALAAYKDIASPWKELLTYYTEVQDMSLRWQILTERFAPPEMLEAALWSAPTDPAPDLTGAVVLDGVSVRDAEGRRVLEDLQASFEAGGLNGVTAPGEEDRHALAALLVREVAPAAGAVRIGPQALQTLPQAVLAAKLGYATARPVLFPGSVFDNAVMAMKVKPLGQAADPFDVGEAVRAGNAPDALSAPWLDPGAAGVADRAALMNWLFELLEATGAAEMWCARGLDLCVEGSAHPDLAQGVVALRKAIKADLKAAGLLRAVHGFNPVAYNPAVPVGDNLLYAAPLQPITPDLLAAQTEFLAFLRAQGIDKALSALSRDVIEMLRQIFGLDGTDHPLFHRLGLEATTYEQAAGLVSTKAPDMPLRDPDLALLLAIPFGVSAEKIGPAFPDAVKARVLALRAKHGQAMRATLAGLYAPLSSTTWSSGLSVLENALYGKISDNAGGRVVEIRRRTGDHLRRAGLTGAVVSLVFDSPVSDGGATLPAVLAEPLAVLRAAVKKPDILVLDGVLASCDRDARQAALERLHRLLPGTTMIALDDEFADSSRLDRHMSLHQGRLEAPEPAFREADGAAGADLARKMRALQETSLFSGLRRQQLRLLAFGARWYEAAAGEHVFHRGDPPNDGAYLIVEGRAELCRRTAAGGQERIAEVGPGTLVGELGLIRNVPRALDMTAQTDIKCLRIGTDEFLAVVENDAQTAFRLLQVVAGYVAT